jgi:mRNA-degrading endonuclease RelE of RelBE toxin-antitoxin system
MPELILSKTAENDFCHLPKTEQKKVDTKLNILRKNPFSGKPLSGELSGMQSLRAWPYRILYEFRKSEKLIIVLRILHSQGAYK